MLMSEAPAFAIWSAPAALMRSLPAVAPMSAVGRYTRPFLASFPVTFVRQLQALMTKLGPWGAVAPAVGVTFSVCGVLGCRYFPSGPISLSLIWVKRASL